MIRSWQIWRVRRIPCTYDILFA